MNVFNDSERVGRSLVLEEQESRRGSRRSRCQQRRVCSVRLHVVVQPFPQCSSGESFVDP